MYRSAADTLRLDDGLSFMPVTAGFRLDSHLLHLSVAFVRRVVQRNVA